MGGSILNLYYNKVYISMERRAHQSCTKGQDI